MSHVVDPRQRPRRLKGSGEGTKANHHVLDFMAAITETIAYSMDASAGVEEKETNPITSNKRVWYKVEHARMNLISPKFRLRHGTWNDRTMYEQGRKTVK